MFTTEYEFVLPKGYIDESGTLHTKGKMKLATAADEITPLKDPRVQQNSAYLTILILARVITKLGTLEHINVGVIEKLFTADLTFLQDMYQRINDAGSPKINAVCPGCSTKFNVPLNFTQMGQPFIQKKSSIVKWRSSLIIFIGAMMRLWGQTILVGGVGAARFHELTIL